MLSLEYSEKANADLFAISVYTTDNFGETQALKYSRQLYSGLELLCQFPKVGTNRPEILSDLFSFPVQHHIVYFTITETKVRVERILNQAQDPFEHLL